MKSIRKVTAVILTLLVVIFAILPANIFAAESVSFIYNIENGRAVIKGFVDEGQSEITVPAMLNGSSVTLQSLIPVIKSKFNGNNTDANNAKYTADNETVKSIILSNGVKCSFGNENIFTAFTALEGITSLNTSGYTTENGVLFNEKTLICYPVAKQDISYITPAFVEAVAGNSFYGNRKIANVELNSSCRSLTDKRSPFTGCVNLTSIATHGSGDVGFYTMDGILYNGKILVHCPDKNTLSSVSIPANITSACSGSISNQYIESLTVNNDISFGTDPYLPNLRNINIGAYAGKTAANYSTCANHIVRLFNRCGSRYVKSLQVAPENQIFAEVNDVLYNYNVTELVVYPIGLTQSMFVLPETVKSVYTSRFCYFNIDGQTLYQPRLNTNIHLSDTQFNTMVVKKGVNQVMFSIFSSVCSNTTRKYQDSAVTSKSKARDTKINNMYYLAGKFNTESTAELIEIYNKSTTLTDNEKTILKELVSLDKYYGLESVYDYAEFFSYAYSYGITICDNKHTTSQTPINNMTKNGNVITKNPASDRIKLDYGTTVMLHAKVPSKGSVQWFVDDELKGKGADFTLSNLKSSCRVKALSTDARGNKILDEEVIIIDTSFRARFVWFFKHLFNP
ncbi:MAG: hypothetical protein MJ121_06770, partial [Clostridia bacterium]|nr:hypothetical protein [Clostridia bacterium]